MYVQEQEWEYYIQRIAAAIVCSPIIHHRCDNKPYTAPIHSSDLVYCWYWRLPYSEEARFGEALSVAWAVNPDSKTLKYRITTHIASETNKQKVLIVNILKIQNLMNIDRKNIITFDLLGVYETADDLLEYKGRLYQPQITVNTLITGNDIYNIKICPTKGFQTVVFSNGKYKTCPDDDVVFVDAAIYLQDNTEITISIDEAREFMSKHYNNFKKYGEPYGQRGHSREFFKAEEERFSSFSSN